MYTTKSWEEWGEDGEHKVVSAIPKGFSYFRNAIVNCQHGNDYEEIDLIAVGLTGIWCVEIKNWRGIAYPGDYREELVFIRKTPNGKRTSFRENPYYQTKDHTYDLSYYLRTTTKKWFPSKHSIVVIVNRDNKWREFIWSEIL